MRRDEFLKKAMTGAAGLAALNKGVGSVYSSEEKSVYRGRDRTEAQSNSFKIGTATKVINPEVGSWRQAAGTVKRGTKIRDDLEANALYLSNGKTPILMVSCDLVGLERGYNTRLREAMGVAAGIPPRNVIVSATHTHGGPALVKTNYLIPLDTLYMKRLKGWLTDLAEEAVHSAQPGKIGWAIGKVRIGFNRRLTWNDGTHTMHGDASRPDFAGLEGPNDPQHTAIFATDMDGNLLSILYNNTTHPTIFAGSNIFSADFPGEVRKKIREKFDRNISVLYLNGAEGDIAISNPLNSRSESKEEKIERISNMVVEETMDLYKEVTFQEEPVLKHSYKDLNLGVRLPAPERLIKSRKILSRIDAGEEIRGMKMIMAFGTVRLQEKYGDTPFDILPIHTIRIGDLAIATQPCELYSQFGLDIKRRSPVPTTMVVGLTDGYHGYVPTISGILGGGYSAKAISWTRLEPYAGYRIVETASQLLNTLWNDYENTCQN